MKLIFENWKRYLAESMSYFGKSAQNFQELIDQGVDPLTAANKALFKLGEGSTRVVYGFHDNQDIVLKVVNTNFQPVDGDRDEHGFTKKNKVVSNQNEVNWEILQQYRDVFPKAYERADDYSWIMIERVDPLEHQEMLSYFGLPSLVNKKAYIKLVAHVMNVIKGNIGLQETSTIGKDSMPTLAPVFDGPTIVDPSKTKTMAKDNAPAPVRKPGLYSKENLTNILLNSPQAMRVLDTAVKLGMPARELKAKNLGTAIRNGKTQVIILDASLWEDR
jgi:hypothetical protein